MREARDASAAAAKASEAALRQELAGAQMRVEVLQKELDGTQAAMKQVRGAREAPIVPGASESNLKDTVRSRKRSLCNVMLLRYLKVTGHPGIMFI